jgi:hypothetical protein
MDGIPVVHCSSEVLEADQRRRTLFPEQAISETDVADLLELGRGGLVKIDLRHGGISFNLD